jgi:hypothetical protein
MVKFPLKQIAGVAIEYLSNLADLAAPDAPTPEQIENVKGYVVPVYALAKTQGNKLVNSSENDLDDQVLDELVEICENVAKKYDFTLDATQIPLT